MIDVCQQNNFNSVIKKSSKNKLTVIEKNKLCVMIT